MPSRQLVPVRQPPEADALVEALSRGRGLVVVDPNPRPNLIADMRPIAPARNGRWRLARLVKLSDEDAELFYG